MDDEDVWAPDWIVRLWQAANTPAHWRRLAQKIAGLSLVFEHLEILAAVAQQRADDLMVRQPLTPEQAAQDYFAANPGCWMVSVGGNLFKRNF